MQHMQICQNPKSNTAILSHFYSVQLCLKFLHTEFGSVRTSKDMAISC